MTKESDIQNENISKYLIYSFLAIVGLWGLYFLFRDRINHSMCYILLSGVFLVIPSYFFIKL